MILLILLFVILNLIGLIVILSLLVDWKTHISQVSSLCKVSGRGNFKIFLREFKKQKWYKQDGWSNSLFGIDYSDNNMTYIHASIIQFDNIGMSLGFIDYLRFRVFMRKQLKEYTNLDTNYKWQSIEG